MYSFPDVVARKPRKPTSPAVSEAHAEGEIFLRAWRKKLRKSLEWVAAEIGTDKGTLSEIETKIGPEGIEARGRWLYKYSRALGVSTEQLLRHPDAEPTISDIVVNAPPELQRVIRELVSLSRPN